MNTQRTPRLSANQRLVLKGMTDKSQGLFHLLRLYDVSRTALLRKGCIVFNAERGMYEVTDAGRAALEKCQGCGGTGAYAPNTLGRDVCIDCDGTGYAQRTSPTVIAAAIAKAGSAA